MSQRFVAVQWNKRKLVYDAIVLLGLAVHLVLFQIVTRSTIDPAQQPNSQVLAMRAWGSAAFLMLSTILAIGPLARLFPRPLKPLLYNRRHLGVIFFFVAIVHARQVLGFYQAFGSRPSLEGLFVYDAEFGGGAVPFQLFGAAALALFALMAATSHDFWQKLLGPRAWKSIHMSVYPAYALIAAHLGFGALRDGASMVHAAVYLGTMSAVGLLHLIAARREARRDSRHAGEGRLLDGGQVDDLVEDRPVGIVGSKGERIALVLHRGSLSALSAVCAHQGGPLDEGRVIDGCLTCPWHGWQYRPEDGASPPPFNERVATHEVTVDEKGIIRVSAEARPLGQPARPVTAAGGTELNEPPREAEDFFVGYLPMGRPGARRSLKVALLTLAVTTTLGLVLAVSQTRGGAALAEPVEGRSFRGLLLDRPYAQLRVLDEQGEVRTILLVTRGKGTPSLPTELVGRAVEIEGGLLLARDASRMLAGGTIRAADLPAAEIGALRDPPEFARGEIRLEGEIVDSKCYFGAMRPGRGQIHRACAQVCIEGGIPPLLAIATASGEEIHVLLTDRLGGPVNELVLPFVAEPIAIRGELREQAGLTILRFDPEGIDQP